MNYDLLTPNMFMYCPFWLKQFGQVHCQVLRSPSHHTQLAVILGEPAAGMTTSFCGLLEVSRAELPSERSGLAGKRSAR